MAKEIERKFKVIKENLPNLINGKKIIQGYLSVTPNVRVRIIDDQKAYITIKSFGDVCRDEYEYEIPLIDAIEMLELCEDRVIEKIRFELGDWEIDVFLNQHVGLYLCEIEFDNENTLIVNKPLWVGDEVTGDGVYMNCNLAKHYDNHLK